MEELEDWKDPRSAYIEIRPIPELKFVAPAHVDVYEVFKEVQARYEAYANCEYENDETADLLIELKDLCLFRIVALELSGSMARLDSMKLNSILDYPT
jgi:hypothetical protein